MNPTTKQGKAPPFVLIPDAISLDVVECTRILHEQAVAGELLGLAYTGMVRRRGYVANAAGEAHRNPTFTIGMLFALIRKLAVRLEGGHF